MSSFHGRTRPDQPRIPQDLATKGYVDARTHSLCDSAFLNTSSNNPLFMWHVRISTLESQVQAPIHFDMTLTRLDVFVQNNSKDGDTVFSFRDDGVSLGIITVGTLLTGLFDSGALSDEIASGSLINFLDDLSASTLGSIVAGVNRATFTNT